MSEEQDLYSDKNTTWRLRGTKVFVFHSPKQLVCIGILHYLPVFGLFFFLTADKFETNIFGHFAETQLT